jgi:hypothetical protein
MIKKCHWSELQGNKYRVMLHPLMLRNRYTITQKSRTTGEPKTSAREVITVEYDESYVECWLITKLFRPLGLDSQKKFKDTVERYFSRYLEGLANEKP